MDSNPLESAHGGHRQHFVFATSFTLRDRAGSSFPVLYFLTVFNHQSVDGRAKLIVSTGASVTTPNHSYRT
jgi:hypothetical protein